MHATTDIKIMLNKTNDGQVIEKIKKDFGNEGRDRLDILIDVAEMHKV